MVGISRCLADVLLVLGYNGRLNVLFLLDDPSFLLLVVVHLCAVRQFPARASECKLFRRR